MGSISSLTRLLNPEESNLNNTRFSAGKNRAIYGGTETRVCVNSGLVDDSQIQKYGKDFRKSRDFDKILR